MSMTVSMTVSSSFRKDQRCLFRNFVSLITWKGRVIAGPAMDDECDNRESAF